MAQYSYSHVHMAQYSRLTCSHGSVLNILSTQYSHVHMAQYSRLTCSHGSVLNILT